MKQKILSRILSIALSALMLTSLVPSAVLAAEPTEGGHAVDLECIGEGDAFLADLSGNELESDEQHFKEGDAVYLSIFPGNGQELAGVTIQGTSGKMVEQYQVENTENLLLFLMPDEDVKASVKFQKVPGNGTDSGMLEVGYGEGTIEKTGDNTFSVIPKEGSRVWRVVGYNKWFETFSPEMNEKGEYVFTEEAMDEIIQIRAFFVTEEEYAQMLEAVGGDEKKLGMLYADPAWFFKYGTETPDENAFNEIFAEYIDGQQRKAKQEGIEFKKPVKANAVSSSGKKLLTAPSLNYIPKVGDVLQGGTAHGDPANYGRDNETHAYYFYFDSGFLAGEEGYLICQQPTRPYPIYYGNYTVTVSSVDPDKKQFTVYIFFTPDPALNPGVNPTTVTDSQDCAGYMTFSYDVLKGTLNLVKSSSAAALTAGNSNYDLSGAEYGVYSNNTCTSKVAVLVTGVDGTSNTVALNTGTYYVKESKPSKGYLLNNAVTSVAISSGNLTTLTTGAAKETPIIIGISLTKESAVPGITDGNPCYSLAGAEFGVYLSSADANNGQNAVYTMTTNAAGKASLNMIPIPDNATKTYYIKETKAPKGFKLDTEIHSVTYDGSTSYLITVEDEPGEDPATIEIKKQSKDPNATQFPLAGVQFKIKYYTNTDGDVSGSAERTWIIQTKLDGSTNTYRTMLSPEYLVEGWMGDSDKGGTKADDASSTLYYNATGQATIPIGTIQVEEIQAATGYTLEGAVLYNEDGSYTTVDAPYVGVITMDMDEAHLSYGNVYTDLNTPVSIKTKARTSNGSQMGKAGQAVVVNDTVTCTGIEAEKRMEGGSWVNIQYRLKGEIRNIKTDELVASATKDFTTDDFDQHQETVSFTIPQAKAIAGNSFYISESLYTVLGETETLVAQEKDKTIADQQIYIPLLSTAMLAANGTKITDATKGITMNDTVTYKNLIPGITYTVNGILMDKATGNAAKDDNGAFITATKNITPATADGQVVLTYQFDGLQSAGKTFVSFNELVYSENVVAEHKDINSAEQSVSVKTPSASTILYNTRNSEKVVYSGKSISVTDQITYSDFVQGKTYTVESRLVDRATGNTYKDADGAEVKKTTTWTAPEESGMLAVTMEFAGYTITAKELVAFEVIKDGDTVIASHEDIDDANQRMQILPVVITTSLVNKNTGVRVLNPSGEISLTDTISFQGLVPGRTYQIKSVLLDSSGSPVKDDSGNTVTKTTDFIPTSASGEVTIPFVFAGAKLPAGKLIATEEIWDDGLKIAEHKDMNDANQTVIVDVPSVKTALSASGYGKVLPQGTSYTLEDHVEITNLEIGKSYRIRGKLMTRGESGEEEELKNKSGNPITASTAFTCTKASEKQTVTYNLTDVELAGRDVIAYESVYWVKEDKEILVAEHKNLNDEAQTLHVSKIDTAASNANGKNYFDAAKTNTVKDEISYQNLQPNTKYQIVSTLVKYATGENVATKTTDFTTTAQRNGKVTVEIPVPAGSVIGRAVVYETIKEKSEAQPVAGIHQDKEDAKQTVYFAKVITKASDADGNSTFHSGESITIKDKVTLSGLQAGKKYLIVTSLMDQQTEQPIEQEDWNFKAKNTLTATGNDDVVNIQMEIPSSKMPSKIVFFETVYDNEDGLSVEDAAKKVCEHTDINDADQILEKAGPSIQTVLTGKSFGKQEYAGKVNNLIDTVSYENVVADHTYTVKGILMDKSTGNAVLDKDGNQITAEKTFTAAAADGTVDVTFEFAGTSLCGYELVAFEELWEGSAKLAEHKDITDADQTVKILPVEIKTELTDDKSKTHEASIAMANKLTDKVSYKKLKAGTEYKIQGILVDKASGEYARDKNGDLIKGSKTFTATASEGTVEVTYEFSNTALKEHSLVAFEELWEGEVKLAEHCNLNDALQTVYISPVSIGTTLLGKTGNAHTENAAAENTFVDTITYNNLVVGTVYTIKGTLMNKNTGNAALTKDGAKITAEKDFKATTADGTVTLEFKVRDVDSSSGTIRLLNETFVAFEELWESETKLAEHKDINDAAQTVKLLPVQIQTSLKDKQTGSHQAFAAKSNNLIDSVDYQGLKAGQKYTISGVLIDKATGNAALDKDGKKITGSATFFPEEPNGTVEVKYDFSNAALQGHSLVAFEELLEGEVKLAEHKNMNDENQTVKILPVNISTTLTSKVSKTHTASATAENVLVDTVSYSNLIQGHTYTLKGTLMNKTTGNAALDKSGHAITATKEFTASSANGAVDVEFKVSDMKDGESGPELINGTFVAFEELWDGDAKLAEHKDLDDTDQTIKLIPVQIQTELQDAQENHETYIARTSVLTDYVAYQNLVAGSTYIIHGMLKDKATGETIVDKNGQPVTGKKEFVAELADGIVDIPYEFSNVELAGRSVVAFEELWENGVKLAEHKNLEDAAQTVSLFPVQIRTELKDVKTDSHMASASEKNKLVDRVSYKKLTVGSEYTVRGALMDQVTGKAIQDKDGNAVTAETKFTAEYAEGTVDVTYEFSNFALAGRSVVAFEELWEGDAKLAEHKNLNDEKQTVKITPVAIRTTMVGNIYKDHEEPVSAINTLIDTVAYENLVPGTVYTLKGTLMNKNTGKEALAKDGTPITATQEFTAKTADGAIEVMFKISDLDNSGGDIRLLNGSFVAFEELWEGSTKLAEHKNINDKNQTVHLVLPEIDTVLLGKMSKGHTECAAPENILVDTISYRGLVAGYAYKVSGVLINKDTKEAALDKDGKPITAEKTFTATAANGTVDLEFVLSDIVESGGNVRLLNETVVAFEEMWFGVTKLAEHKDINDADQTVKRVLPEIGTILLGDVSKDHTEYVAKENTVTDTVAYTNLRPGTVYTVKGTLMNKVTKEPALDKDGKPITAERTFTATAANGTVKLEFVLSDIDNADGKIRFRNETFVAFEELWEGNTKMAVHKDIDDAAQTVKLLPVQIKTELTDDRSKTHEAAIAGTDKLTDCVFYQGLVPGREYTVLGTLIDKTTREAALDKDGKAINAKVVFEAKAETGTVEIPYVFSNIALAGKSLVAFEELWEGDVKLAEHKNLEDEKQTVKLLPVSLETTLLGKVSKDHAEYAGQENTVIDTVAFTNLIPGTVYTVKGTLMNQATKEPALDKDGKPITAEKRFAAVTANGTVDLEFALSDIDNTDGKIQFRNETFVAFEELWEGEVKLAEHKDIDDAAQTVKLLPVQIQTELKDRQSARHEAYIAEVNHLTDRVAYRKFVVGNEYTVTGILMDKETGEPALDKDGKTITGKTTFTAKYSEGFVDVEFTFTNTELKGHSLVAFEELWEGKTKLAEHKDLEDEKQNTDILPLLIFTTATDDLTKDHVSQSGKFIQITDAVLYQGLAEGHFYTLKGTLMDAETGNVAKDDDGKAITSEITFKAESESGVIQVPFSFDGESLAGKKLVAFEELWEGKEKLAEHKDLEDADQTVYLLKIRTFLTANGAEKVTTAKKDVSLQDLVLYTGLLPNRIYRLEGQLFIPGEDGKPIPALDKDGKEILAETTFLAKEEAGIVAVNFLFLNTELEGANLVAFEKLYLVDEEETCLVTEHCDILDEDQTIHISKVRTDAIAENGLRVAGAGKDHVITDTVSAENLLPDTKYQVSGVLMDQKTGMPILYKDEEIRSSAELETDEKGAGTAEVIFKVPKDVHIGAVVVFEEISSIRTKMIIGMHQDLQDEAQTVYFTSMKTIASGKGGQKTIDLSQKDVVQDIIYYQGLQPGLTYQIQTELVDPSNGKVLKIGEKEMKCTTEFIPETSNGEITVSMDAAQYGYKGNAVFFETVLEKESGAVVWEGKDINDKDETVSFKWDKNVKTGDTSNPWLWGILMGISALMAGLAFAFRKKIHR